LIDYSGVTFIIIYINATSFPSRIIAHILLHINLIYYLAILDFVYLRIPYFPVFFLLLLLQYLDVAPSASRLNQHDSVTFAILHAVICFPLTPSCTRAQFPIQSKFVHCSINTWRHRVIRPWMLMSSSIHRSPDHGITRMREKEWDEGAKDTAIAWIGRNPGGVQMCPST
jgi:hypothetical protein